MQNELKISTRRKWRLVPSPAPMCTLARHWVQVAAVVMLCLIWKTFKTRNASSTLSCSVTMFWQKDIGNGSLNWDRKKYCKIDTRHYLLKPVGQQPSLYNNHSFRPLLPRYFKITNLTRKRNCQQEDIHNQADEHQRYEALKGRHVLFANGRASPWTADNWVRTQEEVVWVQLSESINSEGCTTCKAETGKYPQRKELTYDQTPPQSPYNPDHTLHF